MNQPERPSRRVEAGEQAPAEVPTPKPTARFRRRAWADFQRALDPLAPPKPLRLRQR